MKKVILYILGLTLLLTVTGIALAVDKGPATITLDFNGKNKKVTNFTHQAHQDRLKDCKICHHKANENEAPKPCKACHQEKKGDAPAIKDAYHANCKECHKKEKKGPTECKDCHERT